MIQKTDRYIQKGNR